VLFFEVMVRDILIVFFSLCTAAVFYWCVKNLHHGSASGKPESLSAHAPTHGLAGDPLPKADFLKVA
jgi:hypothetical protein